MKRSCNGCANRAEKECLTMREPPREKFCYKTLEDAIKTEYALIEYASRTQPVSGLSTYRVKCNKRIKELEDIHERGIRKANGSYI